MTFDPATHGRDRVWSLRHTLVALRLAGALALPLVGAAALPDAQRTNGAETLQALQDILRGASASTLQLGKTKDQSITGVAITEDGYVLTQASDAAQLKPLYAHFSDGTTASTREVKRSERLNLLLLKLDRTGLRPVQWGNSKSLQIGQWLCATTQQGRELRLGVCSAKRRTIPNSGAVLGVRFGADDVDPGVVVEEVAEQSPAQKAGLQAEDLILAVDDQRVARNEQLSKLIASRRPGDVVKVRYAREGQETECEVRLESKRHVLLNWNGADFANHGTSLRTDHFPEVLQHDLPLNPADMGGAVYNLRGQAVALNIARVDRVTNYALPVEIFLPEVERWIREDQSRG